MVECLCERGYSGARCDRCSFGYYGNPKMPGGSCKPCNCEDDSFYFCDRLTGECLKSGEGSSGDHCHDCDRCSLDLHLDLEIMDDVFAELKHQLQKFSNSPASLSRLKHMEVNITETETLVRMFSRVLRRLDMKAEQLEKDVEIIGGDLSRLIDKKYKSTVHVDKVSQNVNEMTLKSEDFLSEAAAHLAATQGLINHQLTEVKPAGVLSEAERAAMMAKTEWRDQDMRERSCRAQRVRVERERTKAHALLELIRGHMTPVDETSDSLMVSLREIMELLSNAEDAVNKSRTLNMKSHSLLQALKHLQDQLERRENTLHPVTDTTKDLLKNVSNSFLLLEEIKQEFETHAAQIDGAKVELFKMLNKILQMSGKVVDLVMKAEEHAEELHKEASEIHQMLLDAPNSTDLLSILPEGAHNAIMNVVEKAEMAANKSREAADGALQNVRDGGLIGRASALKDNSSHLHREAKKTQSELNMRSFQDDVKKKKEKGESLRMDMWTIREDLKTIRPDDTDDLINSATSAAAASNSSVSEVTDRLKRISQDVDRTSSNRSESADDVLTDADQTLKKLNSVLPALMDKLKQVDALSEAAPPSGNMTESIRRIKELIEEARTFVKRLSAATNFSGKSHVELHPPRNLDDIRAFTAVDLLLNLHLSNSTEVDKRRRRRQDKDTDQSFFVLYLGCKNGTGDFVGMAVRDKVLVCVYKLAGVVHEIKTSQITQTAKGRVDFDRVVFHRAYQDAEVNITKHIHTQKPTIASPKRHRPDTMSGVLELDQNSVVFYVGGYPQNFMPPKELHYPHFRGMMKLSYINDFSVSLFNYKHAINLEAKQPAVKIPQSDTVDYYEGTGYRLVFLKDPGKVKTRLFRFHMKSRETNGLIFYIGNQESFFCLFVERGFLVLQGHQAGRQIRIQSHEKVLLFDKSFAIIIGEKFIVHCGPKQISTDHIQTNYRSFYIGGLPDQLRQRNNITAAPLRGCVDHVKVDSQIVDYDRTIGVGDGCPAELLGVRAATLYSPLSIDSLFDRDEQLLTISAGFRTTHKNSSLLRSSSQGSTFTHELQLSLDDGFLVFSSDGSMLRSEKRYSDGEWHYFSAVRRTTGLELIIDNKKEIQRQSAPKSEENQTLQRGEFKGCISNLYTRRPEWGCIPADLSSFPLSEDAVLGRCDLHPPDLLPLPEHRPKRPQEHRPIQAPAGRRCRPLSPQLAEYQLLQDNSWVSYNLPQEDLNYRPHFSLHIKTRSSKGLILHVAGRGVIPLLALYVANGKIKMSLGYDRIIHHKQKSNDGDWHQVEFSVERSSFHLLVDGIRVTDGHLSNNEGSSLDLMNPVSLGGDPEGRTTKGHSIPMNSVIGCVRDFKMNEVVVEEPEGRHIILPCSDGLTEMGAYFGGGHIVKDQFLSLSSQFVLSFELRPERLTGLLFYALSHKSSFGVFLMEEKVVFGVKDGVNAVSLSVIPPENLCDNNFHLITVSRQKEEMKLEVDSKSERTKVPFMSTWSSKTPGTLYIGGTTDEHELSVPSPFVGCLRNVKLNGLPVSLEKGSSMVHPVNVKGCPPQ
ncbi:laminin subunit alpha-3-like [Cheilinus undulatus]|uniref:laminin subunit alpha-3-like n=1 Tax=Cheilinus undulatus TaxID=241271 RepID=UPI001BD566EF|nr:laminin subunit alpha-3-like [Cheilinus undulatus]